MPVVGKRFRDALTWAAELHEDQERKGGRIPTGDNFPGANPGQLIQPRILPQPNSGS